MRVFNADGGEAEMCGNGIRCVVRYLFEGGEIAGTCAIETLAGTIACEVVSTEPTFQVRVDLGEVRFPNDARDETLTGSPPVLFVRVEVGNPHAVVFCDDVTRADLPALARRFAADERFAGGTNVHAAQVSGPNELRARHFERGVGETAACGTGAVAVAAISVARGLVATPVRVLVPGGCLQVDWRPGGSAHLSGPAEWEPRTLATS
jgi:diaminopimelate epimerase